MDFLWHKVSEKEKEKIKKQAESIMQDFSKKLSRVENLPESVVEREEGEREEAGECDKNFSREIMFKNAPEKNKDFIIAEKGEW